MTTQTQFIASWKPSLQLAGTTLGYSGPKCSPKHLDQGDFKGKNLHPHISLIA